MLNLTGPPASCKDLQLNAGLQVDGEQTLTVLGKELQVSHRAQILMLCWKMSDWIREKLSYEKERLSNE